MLHRQRRLLDLDQLSVAEALPAGAVKLLVAVADVAALVPQGSAIDAHARKNTTSVYTAGGIFPMLPEKLSTDLTSLGFGADRRAIVIEMVFSAEGALTGSDVYEAVVQNKAKLAYNSVAAWLGNTGPMPAPLAAVPGLAENIRLQDRVAEQLRALRHKRGALSLQTIEARPVFIGDVLNDLAAEQSNQAKNLIEDLMVAANGVTARFLAAKKFPSLRRVVRIPEKWDRIVEVAAAHGATLPNATPGRGASWRKFPARGQGGGSGAFPRPVAQRDQVDGRRRIRRRAAGRHDARAFRPRGEGLRPLDRAEPPLSRPAPPAPTEGGARRRQGALTANEELAMMLAEHCTSQEDAAKKVERQLVKLPPAPCCWRQRSA